MQLECRIVRQQKQQQCNANATNGQPVEAPQRVRVRRGETLSYLYKQMPSTTRFIVGSPLSVTGLRQLLRGPCHTGECHQEQQSGYYEPHTHTHICSHKGQWHFTVHNELKSAHSYKSKMRNKDAKFNLRSMQTETETAAASATTTSTTTNRGNSIRHPATPETGRCKAADTLNTFCQLTSSDVAPSSSDVAKCSESCYRS